MKKVRDGCRLAATPVPALRGAFFPEGVKREVEGFDMPVSL
jgi:hypothetical protein